VKDTQLDPEFVDALVEAYNAGRIHSLLQDYYKRDSRSLVCPFCSTHIRIGENASLTRNIYVPVCGRKLLIREENGVFFAELLPQADTNFTIISFHHTPRPEK
jgi:hypothetical protein